MLLQHESFFLESVTYLQTYLLTDKVSHIDKYTIEHNNII